MLIPFTYYFKTKWTYGRGRCMLHLLDIPKGWIAQFMFKRALESSAKDMERQAYMQGIIDDPVDFDYPERI